MARAALLVLILIGSPCIQIAHAQQSIPAVGSEEDARLIAKLVRSTLLALHHANVTGDFGVLYALGSPSFRERNNPGSLYQSFSALRAQAIQLDDVAVLQPALAPSPTIEGGRYLKVSGSFPTKPNALGFELIFELVNKVWMVVGLSVWSMD